MGGERRTGSALLGGDARIDPVVLGVAVGRAGVGSVAGGAGQQPFATEGAGAGDVVSYFHTLVMRKGSLEAEWQGASTRRFSFRIGELSLLGLGNLCSAICDECRGG